jgi:hypothetical protein
MLGALVGRGADPAETGSCPAGVNRRLLRNERGTFGDICPRQPGDTERSGHYVEYMLSTLLVIGGVLVGLIGLLAVIVSLSARPSAKRGSTTATRPYPSWVADSGRPHPDAWSPLSTTSTEIRAIR